MPTLKLGGQEFACREQLPPWQLMKVAKAMKSGDLMEQLAASHDFLVAVVQPAERARFDAYMDTADFDEFSALDTAIGSLMQEYAPDRPTGRPSSSPSGPPPTGGTSKVVSLSRGTVEMVGSSTAGRSAAS